MKSLRPVLLLNSPVLTSAGTYHLSACSTSRARARIVARGFVSAIGHEAAAQVFSRELRIDCPVRRVREVQEPGQGALVLRLAERPEEGAVLTQADMESVGYEWLWLERLN